VSGIDCHACGHPLGSLMHVLGCEESPDRPELWAPLDDVADRGTMCDMTLDCNQLADEAYDLADLIVSNQAKRVQVLEKLHAFGAAFRALGDTGPVPSAPARTTDPLTSHKAAKQETDLRRFSGNTTIRVDSNNGIRGSLNLNQPLIRNLLGLRLAGLKTDEKDYREGVGSKTDRFYGSLMMQPSRRFSFRGWYERYDSKQRNAANTLVADRVSPWLANGRPLFNNAGLTATSTAAAATRMRSRRDMPSAAAPPS
jgi:hypothetical protein